MTSLPFLMVIRYAARRLARLNLRSLLAAIGLGVGCVGLTACAGASHHRELAYHAQQVLIGKTKEELLACAGPPVSEKVKSGRTVLVYYREASQLEESFPGSKGSFAMVHHGYRATIMLLEDHIDEVRYESVPRSYRDEDHCEDVFAGCVPREPVQGTP